MIRALLIFLCLLSQACTKSSSVKETRVGLDPSWFPLAIPGRESSVTGFSTELLKEIGKIEKISFTKVTVNWDDLVDGLHMQKYVAILSSMPPYDFNKQTYDFSELYLLTGPVLVVSIDSDIDSIKKLSGKEIAVLPETRGALIVEKNPAVIIRDYDVIPKALSDVANGNVDGAIVNVLSAVAYCQDLYKGKLKVVTDPLTNEGLRMITRKGDEEGLIRQFNRGLHKLKSSGAYDKLLAKWNLKEKCNGK
jgi:polar amino acid transport system substrate-binding protein